MGLLDWFKKPNEVSYNSQVAETTTIDSEEGYGREFPTSYYYYGYLLNTSSLYTIQVIILKNNGYTTSPLTMEPITKLAIRGVDIKQIVVRQPSSLNNGTVKGATFRYDFIGSTQPPLPGNELIEISPYHRTAKVKQINITRTAGYTPGYVIYNVPDGYKLNVYGISILFKTSTTTGTRQAVIAYYNPSSVNPSGYFNTIYGILVDTGSQTGTGKTYAAGGSIGGENISSNFLVSDNMKNIKWGGMVTIGAGNQLLVSGTFQSNDYISAIIVDAELVQI